MGLPTIGSSGISIFYYKVNVKVENLTQYHRISFWYEFEINVMKYRSIPVKLSLTKIKEYLLHS